MTRSLRLYLWLLVLAVVALGICQAVVLRTVTTAVLYQAAALLVLTHLVQYVRIAVGNIDLNLTPTADIAAVMLLPPPFPLLIALVSTYIGERRRQAASYKRVFNATQSGLQAGGASAAYTLCAAPILGTPAAHLQLINPVSLIHIIIGITTATILYVALDAILIQIAMETERGVRPRPSLAWLSRAHVVPGAAALQWGIVGALLYTIHPVLVAFLALPLYQSRKAMDAVRETHERAEALERHAGDLERIIATGEATRIDESATATPLTAYAEAARAIVGATAWATYLPSPQDDTVYDLATTSGTPLPIPSRLTADKIAAERAAGMTYLVLSQSNRPALGYIRLENVPPLTSQTSSALRVLAAQATLAVANLDAYRRLADQVQRDGLTGLPNHRGLHAELQAELARATAISGHTSIVLIDLDDFATVNATADWGTGDTALLAVGRALQGLRPHDALVARFGGDEFALLLPATAIEDARRVAVEVRRAIGRISVGAATTLRASIGVATVGPECISSDDALVHARRAMRAARAMGGDRVATVDDADRNLIDLDPRSVMEQLAKANMAAVTAFAASVDAKDPYTQGHSQRVAAYTAALAHTAGYDQDSIARIHLAGLLHDVGKIAVPDHILMKPDRLTQAEFDEIKKHPGKGEEMLRQLGYIDPAILPAVRGHHERWDGRGYPDGLAGLDIHPDAALMAVADAFDAMTSDRPYRKGMSREEAIARVEANSGTQFSPTAVDAFRRTVADGSFLAALTAPPPLRTAVGD